MPAFRALIIAIALVFTCSLVGIVPEAAASNGGNNINPSATATKKKKKPAPQVTKTKPKKAVASASNAPAKGEKRYRTGEVLFVLIAGKTDDDLQDLVRKLANGKEPNKGVNPDEVDYVNAHATSTPVGDIAETRALQAVLGDPVGQLLPQRPLAEDHEAFGAARRLLLKRRLTTIALSPLNSFLARWR